MKKLLPIVVAALVLIATQAFGATAYRYNDSVTTLRGDAVGGASVTVYLAGTTTKATIYLYGSTAVEKSNPTYTDGYGRYFFYAEPGLYDLTIAGSNVITYTVEDVRIFSDTGYTYNVLDYGAIPGDGVDDSAAIQAAVSAAEADSGGTVIIPAGSYLASEINANSAFSDETGVFIIGDGANATKLLASADSTAIIRWSTSYGGVEGLSLLANGHAGVTGLRIAPEDEEQTTTRVHQDYNAFKRIMIEDCDEGIVLQCGPYVSSAVSGCYFNTFDSISINRCLRGIWFKDGPNALSSGSNRNQFWGVRIGLSMNTGIQIDSGGTNSFFGVSVEEVATGTSPNTTPTGIKILATAPVGTRSNGNNMFYGLMVEGCTQDLDCEATTSEFYGHSIVGSKINVTGDATIPNVFLSAQSGTTPVGFKKQQYNDAMNDELGGGAPEIFVKGGTDPSSEAFSAPVGSIIMHTSGVPYVKYSSSGTAWRALKTDAVLAAVSDDTTPSVAGARYLATPANTVPTELTQLDGASAYQIVTIIVTSATNPPTITDGGNFSLSASWSPGIGDTITLMTTDSSAWFEISRSDN
jgi:hypothetical protein